VASPPSADPGCVALTITRETNQARAKVGQSSVGFANRALYQLDRSDSSGPYAAITDVNKPSFLTALLRGYVSDLHELRIATIKSSPHPLVEGTD
jgi:hypothetical protein